jgi:sirohydrochlorin ferrochelatase
MTAPATMQSEAMRRSAAIKTLVLTAHGSRDPRSAANARAVAGQLARKRPALDVRLAFCEHNAPSLVDVLDRCPEEAVVTPLLLADAYHARVDIPSQIARSGADVAQADVLGEDPRLISLLRQRITNVGVSRHDVAVGVLVAAIGSSDPLANARTGRVAHSLLAGTRWAGATTAFVTRPNPSLAEAADLLRLQGARRVVIAPWFLAPGVLPDRVRRFADGAGIALAEPLGAHRLVAETVLSRFDQALKTFGRAAA